VEDRFSSIDWDDLRVFLAVARAGSLRGAARALSVNHATVTRRLGALEAALGSRLFDRTPDGFAANQAGEDLLVSAERVEGELFAAWRKILGRDSDPGGAVRVSLPFAIMRGFLAADLAAFSRQYPGIDLEIELTDSFSDLARREADVSIRMAYEVTEDVVGRRLLRYAKAIYAAPDLLSGFDPAAQDEDHGVAWIGWGGEGTSSSWTRDTPFPKLPVRHRLPTHALQLDAAKAGLGLTMLPCFLGDGEPGLRRVPDTAPIADRGIWLLLHNDLRNSARVRAFVDFMAPAILRRRALLEGRG
jgi:DNA-binding transcriptional LysR family regulator